MKKIIPLLIIVLAILFCGCNKEKFTCKITSPKNGATVLISNNLTIKVEVKDSKSAITKVILILDGFLPAYETVTKPYTFIIPSEKLTLGMHTIDVSAINLDGESAQSSITINVVEKGVEAESPDFVTFTNGQFPTGWSTYTWEIDNQVGYKDNYSLKSANYPTALVFANKTMKAKGFVEFYSKGDNIEFFIDDVEVHAISSVADGNWVKRV
jgi:hypothetical protein